MIGCSCFKSSISKKMVVAVTGLLLLGFVLAHLAGNLLVFAGPEALNQYALKLRKLGPVLWIARIGLLMTALLHILTSIKLARENRQARPTSYKLMRSEKTTYAAKTMLLSGLIVLGFIILHLLHFTFRTLTPEISNSIDSLGHHDVYSMVVNNFKNPVQAGLYVFAISLLSFHLSHGVASVFQTLGIISAGLKPKIKFFSLALSALIFFGYASIPLAIVSGVIK